MNKTLLALLVTCSVSVSAAPYVGLEYGLGTTDHDLEPHFSADNVTLNPELEDGIFSGFVGYAFNDNWALELGYSQFDLDDSRSKNLGIKPIDGKDYHHEMDWDASIKAKQVSLAPVFNYALNDKWTTKFKAGLTYTQYDAKVSKHQEYELVANDDVEMTNTLFHSAEKNNEFGAMFSVGAEYQVFPKLTIGANAKYQLDSYANTASFNVGTTYYF
ncbi:porin family protein [Vibrio parahaemolyticus]|uniref:AcfA family outer membrane beta-barrel protein n=1 Tax=Vibrio parahaemolyticus TaxID=670 RepID=UPI00111F9780|nr:AcfA family outer membrane beta-barrel protein [Vibrio parahaemolyticus]EHK0032477.1 porin family protein [Vibrio parahaemolyticus]MDF4591417.1 AcfA family outer membrane beta-barrel protein [Vibrio parahaemolyticus]TOQ89656.1 organic solvent ABC transporter substrate-binding protein [Vibrio parahaemolyticus]